MPIGRILFGLIVGFGMFLGGNVIADNTDRLIGYSIAWLGGFLVLYGVYPIVQLIFGSAKVAKETITDEVKKKVSKKERDEAQTQLIKNKELLNLGILTEEEYNEKMISLKKML